MNREEAMRQTHQENVLTALGFTRAESDALRRISMTLRRWFERECNGEIQRGDDGIARGYRVNARFLDPNDPRYWYRVQDRETGALKRLQKIVAGKNVSTYVQRDPRGAALYILRPGDVPPGADASAHYNRGICVY